ncbi:deoxyribose-phosphate aldolase [Agathobaculum sp.]|uniref:deoxyribose-phosphate aldolase n=1 Tax=Agathobaculum sp. TaxID=2048138 RepID=UPI002A7F20C0|nr:deoxyribose-phosphate aldolase [Agathobaculum sp.]MDY3618636.1 deoxyribose-phosphate aldolase [Agathobaculum sp.]
MNYPITTKTDFSRAEMAAKIDHSMLVPYTTEAEIDQFLHEVRDNGFKVACVNNCYTKKAAEFFRGTDIKVATVVAFPFGALEPASKAAEVERSIALGAGTIDIVSNIGAIKSHDWALLREDYAACAAAAHGHGITIKAILECCYLTDAEKIRACEIAMETGMDYVKTSTGFGTGAAILGDVKLMKDVVGEKLGVKAAGPIADYQTARAMLMIGADRLGSRRGMDILRGCPDSLS